MPTDDRLEELFNRYQQDFADFGGIEIRDVNQAGMGEDRLIHLAASHASTKDVERLLTNGADVNAKGDLGLTPLHLAASKGRLDVVQILLKHGARKHIKNDFGELPIDWGKNNNQDDVAQNLE